MSKSPLIQVENFSVSFCAGENCIRAIDSISFTIFPGEILALVGESGSGKSLTALSILQLLPKSPSCLQEGHIYFWDGQEKISLTESSFETLRYIRGNKIGMVFQEPMSSLNPVLSCGRQVTEVLCIHKKITFTEAKKEVIQLFADLALPLPEKIFNKFPHQLSGGQQQRVMIAMAICCKPALLICDEPTTALDTIVQKNLLQLILTIRVKYQIAVLFISHDLGVVSELADRIAVLYKGNIVETGLTHTILTSPQHPYTKGLLLCRPVLYSPNEKLPVVQDFLEGKDMPQPVVKKIPPPHQAEMDAGKPTIPVKILLSLHSVKVAYPVHKHFSTKKQEAFLAVNNVQFDIYEGETVGLVGASGCGKTTLGRALLGLMPLSGGQILFKGKNLADLSKQEAREMKTRMQIVFQDPYSSLNPMIKIGDAIAEPLRVHKRSMGDYAIKNKVVELLEKTGLDPSFYHRYPHACSGGQRQRIVIARALALEPEFVVFDESVSALDLSVQAQVLNLLNSLKKIFGFTALFISHDLSVVQYLSDRLLIMDKGQIVEMGDTAAIYNHPTSTFTKQLLAAIPGKKYFASGTL